MIAIKGVVLRGKVEVDEPIDLPDGTELTISVPIRSETLGVRDEDWSDSPEAIEAWLRWYDALEPVEFTPDERDAARKKEKASELAQLESRSKHLEELSK